MTNCETHLTLFVLFTGAQIFEIVGIGTEVVDRCFRGTQSRLGGVSLDIIAGKFIFGLSD